MITQTTELNLIPNGSPIRIHVDQYDEGVGRLVFRLYEDDVEYSPIGATAVIQGCKPDGRGFNYNCTLSGNTVTADLTRQMTAVNGSVRTQIVVTESDGRIGSFAFIIEVQRSALPSDTDMSESEYQIIEQAILATQDAALDAEAWAVGERGGDPVGPSDPTYHNNAEYWAYMASQYAQGGIIYKGSCLFANIPVSGMHNGDMWNIEDDFTTDSRFKEGAGIACVAGTNIVWNGSKWDLFAVPKTGVQSFNGRTGIVTPQAGDYDLTDLGDIVVTSATDGQVLTWDATSQKWVNGNASGGSASLADLDDVSLSSPTNGQVLKYNSTSQKWENANESGGGGGDYVGLYGMTEIQSSDGQGTTPIDLDTYTTIGNYFCNGKGQVRLTRYPYYGTTANAYSSTYSSVHFLLYVIRISDTCIEQRISIVTSSGRSYNLFRSATLNNNVWAFDYWHISLFTGTNAKNLSLKYGFSDITLANIESDDVLVYDSYYNQWMNKPVLNDLIKWSEASKSVKKNLLHITLVTQTYKGITFTVNNDGTVTLNGTASADIYMPYMSRTKLNLIQGEKYILSGCYKQTGLQLSLYPNVPNNPTYRDNGDGAQFTCEYPTADYGCINFIKSGTVLNNVVFKPMLRLASIADATYEPYIPDNTELMRYSDNAILGAKNLLPNKATSQTVNGVTFTVNSDGSIKVNGTASALILLSISNKGVFSAESGIDYILSGSPINSSGIQLGLRDSNGAKELYSVGGRVTDTGSGAKFNIDDLYWVADLTHKVNLEDTYVMIRIPPNEALNNVVFKPMIRLATDTDDTYVPYAMTNRELTEELTVQAASITTPIQTQEWILHYVKKYGKVVEAVVTMKLGENVSAWGTIAQIPTGFRPSAGQYPQVVGIKGDYTSFINLQIAPSGDVQTAGALTSGTTIRFDATYIIN